MEESFLFQIISRVETSISNPSRRDSTEGMIHFHHSQGGCHAAKLHKFHNKRTDTVKSYGQNIKKPVNFTGFEFSSG